MKIVICTKKDLAACLALNRLLDALAGRHEIVVILSDYVLDAERSNPHALHLMMHERDLVLDYVFPWLDREFPKGSGARCLTYRSLPGRHGVPMELWGPIRRPEAAAAMAQIAPDVILSVRYDYVFRDNVIGIPRLGIYGLHPGALPRFQGLCSPFRAMEHNDARSGCTLFHLDKGLDTGPIVDIGWWDIAYQRSALWNFVHTYFAGIDALLRHMPILEGGRPLSTKPQPSPAGCYFSYPTENEFESFIRRGGHLVLGSDYLEMLSWFLPDGLNDPRLPELADLVSRAERTTATAVGTARPAPELQTP